MGLFAALVDDEFLATLLLLRDVFAAIAPLNLALQKSHESLCLSDIKTYVEKSQNSLQNLLDNKRPWFVKSNFDELKQNALEQIGSLFPWANFRKLGTFKWDDFEKNVYCKFVHSFKVEIDGAFDQLAFWLNFIVFDPRKLPESRDDLDAYGRPEIDDLTSFYGQDKTDVYKGKSSFQKADINSINEWEGFKSIIFEKRKAYREKIDRKIALAKSQDEIKEFRKIRLSYTPSSFWEDCIHATVLEELYPNCLKLLYLLMIFLISTACVERLFSEMKLVKTRLRNPLKQSTLESPTEYVTDLNLCSSGLRIGHWNVNYLTSEKFDQICLFLTKSGEPQVDILLLSETFLKPDTENSFYCVSGFSIFRKDRLDKHGGGVMALVNNTLTVKRRVDLEVDDLEVMWLEVYPFKSKRSLLISVVYRPPNFTNTNDSQLEENFEQAYLTGQEVIMMGDFNIDFCDKNRFSKHHLSKELKAMNFKQLVNGVTRPASQTCLDHIYSNYPERITDIIVPDIGLSDHLPIFMRRKYFRQSRTIKTIRYRHTKTFDENDFKRDLSQVPWDTVFAFDDINDMLHSWELLFNDVLDLHCPWREKKIKRDSQPKWINENILKHLHIRDNLLKKAKGTQNCDDWASYRKSRNYVVKLIRESKMEYYSGIFEENVVYTLVFPL